MENIALSDETVDPNMTSAYQLFLQAGSGIVSYCLLDTARNKYIALKHYVFNDVSDKDNFLNNLETIIQNDDYLMKTYKNVRFIYITQKSSLLPSPLFDKEKLRDYFRFNHPLSDSENVAFNRMGNAGAYNLFAVPAEIENLIKYHFPDASIYHQATSFIESFLIRQKGKSISGDQLCVNVHTGFFDAAVYRAGNLTLFNSFAFSNETDFAYYLMYICEQLKLNPASTEVILSGQIEKKSDLYGKIKLFLKNIRFEKRNQNYIFSYTLNDIPAHSFLHLFNVTQCE